MILDLPRYLHGWWKTRIQEEARRRQEARVIKRFMWFPGE